MTNKFLRLGALVLPLLVLGYQVVALERDLADHTTWRIPIAGFDPRDPIRGHYVRYRYDWPLTEEDIDTCQSNPAECQLCLKSAGGDDITVSIVMAGDAIDHCEGVVDVGQDAHGNQPTVLDGQRYYLDEVLARQADRALRQGEETTAEMDIAVTRSGRVRAQRLILDGVPLGPRN